MDRDALMIMDVQRGIVERYADEAYLDGLCRAIAAARAGGMPVLFVRVGFRPGWPEVSDHNQSFRAIKERAQGPTLGEVHPDLGLQPDDVIITKKRVSAFTGSDLEVILRAQNIRHLVLAGIATSGVVLSTVREAADRDYALTVLEDGCRDSDPEVHRVLMEKVFVRQAQVTTIASFVAGMTGKA
jgi:nicotinamidase-related amidase